jgi:hypothetical protein
MEAVGLSVSCVKNSFPKVAPMVGMEEKEETLFSSSIPNSTT